MAGVAKAQHITLNNEDLYRVSQLYEDEDEVYDLIDIDTLMYVENAGVTRLLINLNGVHFKLAISEEEVENSSNAFLIPEQGNITLGIGRYILPGVINQMELRSQGPSGSSANIIIADALIEGQTVSFRIRDLTELPQARTVSSAYPNPFTNTSQITVEIAETRITGVPITLSIYDIQGRLIRTLANGTYFPGAFAFRWDGTDETGRSLAAGVYFYRILSDDFQETRKLVKLR